MSAAPLALSSLAAAPSRTRQRRGWLEDAAIARAMARPRPRASRRATSWRASPGLVGAAYARALAAAFDYRYVDADELARIEPDFAKLRAGRGDAPQLRRRARATSACSPCSPIRSMPRCAAGSSCASRGRPATGRWPRARTSPISSARRAEALRAIDAVLPDAQRGRYSASRGSITSRTCRSARTRARWCGWCTPPCTTR